METILDWLKGTGKAVLYSMLVSTICGVVGIVFALMSAFPSSSGQGMLFGLILMLAMWMIGAAVLGIGHALMKMFTVKRLLRYIGMTFITTLFNLPLLTIFVLLDRFVWNLGDNLILMLALRHIVLNALGVQILVLVILFRETRKKYVVTDEEPEDEDEEPEDEDEEPEDEDEEPEDEDDEPEDEDDEPEDEDDEPEDEDMDDEEAIAALMTMVGTAVDDALAPLMAKLNTFLTPGEPPTVIGAETTPVKDEAEA